MKLLSSLVLSLTVCCSAMAADKPSFADYVAGLKKQAIEQGFDASFVDQTLADIRYYKRAVTADKNQPETKVTLDTYLPKRVPDWKVKQALGLMAKHKPLLDKVAKHYGVQSRFIVSLWGNESNFGKIQGNYRVLSALATLAYDGRREKLFKKEFFAALNILKEGHIGIDAFKGSWAGAMGQTQFLPSSYLSYAVDFDGDGKKDIWSNPADVFASIANYLKNAGWDDSQTWGRQVKLPSEFDFNLASLKKDKMKSLPSWQQMGITTMEDESLPSVDIQASLIMPDSKDGRAYLVYGNFHALMKWNRSTYFGCSVGYLADRILLGR